MVKRVLIIGGYGNFGQRIAKQLATESTIQLIIAGRNMEKAQALSSKLKAYHSVEYAQLDIFKHLSETLSKIKPDIVVHTSGPYQEQGYDVAQACIQQGCHYIDLADAREFVMGITKLDAAAKENNVFICSGASSVPCLTSAIVNHYQSEFQTIEALDYAIATSQLTNLGIATTQAGLSYAGRPFLTRRDGTNNVVYGWLDLRMRKFWGLGNRLLGNCDIPDLALFPDRYPEISNMRFQAGLELKFLQSVLWLLSYLVRFRLSPDLQRFAKPMMKISRYFDIFGTDDSGFYMDLKGKGHDGTSLCRTFEIFAKHGDGLYIPCVPSIILCKKIAMGMSQKSGVQPCIDLITLDEYLAELKGLDIEWREK